jgi:hypothetical protein
MKLMSKNQVKTCSLYSAVCVYIYREAFFSFYNKVHAATLINSVALHWPLEVCLMASCYTYETPLSLFPGSELHL